MIVSYIYMQNLNVISEVVLVYSMGKENVNSA